MHSFDQFLNFYNLIMRLHFRKHRTDVLVWHSNADQIRYLKATASKWIKQQKDWQWCYSQIITKIDHSFLTGCKMQHGVKKLYLRK